MKIVGKEKLEIKALNDGSIEIGYNFGNNNNNSLWDLHEIVNINTREQFKLKDLFLLVDKNDVFLYTPAMQYLRKKDSNYKLSEWIFLNDSRAERALNKNWREPVTEVKDNILRATHEPVYTAPIGQGDNISYTGYNYRETIRELVKEVEVLRGIIKNTADSTMRARFEYESKKLELDKIKSQYGIK